MPTEKKIPVGLNLPVSILMMIDDSRGRVSRSTYVTIILEQLAKEGMAKFV
ncbi:MAG: hypothetical protein ACHQ03_04690 [Candidatus Bathyarchaeia archaeon]